MQPQGELEERKSKEMKAKLLSFPFVFFSESGIFKGLRREKMKKSGAVQLASQVARQAPRTDIDPVALLPPSSRIWAPGRPSGRRFLNHANAPSATPWQKQESSRPLSPSEKE
ncbi:MAG: hypothetical protein WA397_22785 [Roseiarcus sp.]